MVALLLKVESSQSLTMVSRLVSILCAVSEISFYAFVRNSSFKKKTSPRATQKICQC